MDPVTMVVVPGFLGGLVVALLIFRLQSRTGQPTTRSFREDPLSTDVINIASIKVAGVGGLGLVAMAATVAMDVPRIGQSMIVGVGFGALTAAFLIVWRRRTGVLPSSGQRPGANTTLAIDATSEPEKTPPFDVPPVSGREPIRASTAH